MDDELVERIGRHGLVHRTDTTVAAAVRRTTALQAQDHPAARLGVRARTRGLTDADVVAAGDAQRSVVRTWLMRGTIHLVAAEDVHWLVALFGPALERKFRGRWRQIGLTEAFLDRCFDVLPAVLADGPRTRAEIVTGLEAAGVAVDFADPQAGTHILVAASCRALLCRAADRGRVATFTLLDDWLPRDASGLRGDEAVAELARRYFAAYSPATTADFATWSGLAAARGVDLIRGELTPCTVGGRAGYRLGPPPEPPGRDVVRLLPAFDNYLLGHRDRPFIADERRGEVYVGGIIRPTVVRDGRVVGRWELKRGRDGLTVVAHPFMPWPARTWSAVAEEAADIGRFLGSAATLTPSAG